MSDKQGPFDLAISLLKGLTKDVLGILTPSDVPKLWAAIRVLEAARRLIPEDKNWLQAMVDQISEYSPVFVSVCPGRAMKDRFRLLLESLPDKED